MPPAAEPAEELRRVRRRKGRRNLANFENLPVTTHVHELSAPGLLAYIVTSKFSDYLPLYRLPMLSRGRAANATAVHVALT